MKGRANKITGANSRPASQFESRGLRRRALVVERHERYHGGAAVAQFGRWATMRTRSLIRGIAFLVGPVVVFFGCWILAAGCSRAHVVVTNSSGTSLSSLVISGSCKERRVDALAPQSEWRAVTPYRGDAVIRFSFSSAGKEYTSNPDIHPGYRGPFMLHFTVDSNMVATSSVIY